jgi:hypothetical protein
LEVARWDLKLSEIEMQKVILSLLRMLPPEKIAELFDKYNPNRKLRLAREAAEKEDKKEDKAI